ncbi:MAG: ComEA family DNA-binding protein [Candidatus Omnitrophota bacterium]
MWQLSLTREERRVLLAIALVALLGIAWGFVSRHWGHEGKIYISLPKIDINSADEAALVSLPGIGPETARAIIDYRIKNNGFSSPDDLRRVYGIGKVKLNRLRPLITTGKSDKNGNIENKKSQMKSPF